MDDDEKIEIHVEQRRTTHTGRSRAGEPIMEVIDEQKPDLEPELRKIGEQYNATFHIERRRLEHRNRHHFDGGLDVTSIKDMILAFGGLSGVAAVLKILWPKAGRIKIQIGTTKIEVNSASDLDAAIGALSKIKKRP